MRVGAAGCPACGRPWSETTAGRALVDVARPVPGSRRTTAVQTVEVCGTCALAHTAAQARGVLRR